MPSAMPMAAMKRMKNTAAAERHGGQRHGVVAAVAADHQVVGYLRENLAQLRQYDGQGQFQIGLVLIFISRETVHCVPDLGCKDS